MSPAPASAPSTLSLHDALPISLGLGGGHRPGARRNRAMGTARSRRTTLAATGSHPAEHAPPRRQEMSAVAIITGQDRKSTRLNSSHLVISYAVFCLKKKTQTKR